MAILTVAIWFYCRRMDIKALVFNQILRFLESTLLNVIAIKLNQYFVAMSTKCCDIVAIKMANSKVARNYVRGCFDDRVHFQSYTNKYACNLENIMLDLCCSFVAISLYLA